MNSRNTGLRRATFALLHSLLLAACFVEDGGTGPATSSTSSSSSGGTGGTSACTTPADCPGSDGACAVRTCIAGVCGVDLAPAGFLAGAQTSGDCQQVVCDGDGNVTTVADDADVPADGDPCTLDVCTHGVPSHADAPAGTACGANGQLACDGHGTCVGCAQDADCGVSTACASYACDTVSGLCTVSYVPSGQGDPGGQTTGDCRALVCNGSGGTLSIADDADAPDDGNPCTIDGCATGQPVHTPESAGAACGNGFLCDGAGQCQACLADADCGASSACATRACVGGTCVTTFVPSGQGDPGGQVAGDCQRLVCDGSGGSISIADDTDVLDDGNPCTADACVAGVPSHALLAAATPCGPGLECDAAGACVGCLMDVECGADTACATHHCQSGTCVTDDTPSGMGDPGGQIAGDCKKIVCNGLGGTTTVPDDTDVPDDGNPCTQDTCSGGAVQHVPVASGTSCGAGLVCNGTTCAAGCVIGGAFFAPDAVDPANVCQVCAPSVSTSAWSARADGTGCDDGNACTQTDTCQNGACVGQSPVVCPPPADAQCTNAGQCDPTTGQCAYTTKPDFLICSDGDLCTDNDHCQSGFCVHKPAKSTCAPPDVCHLAFACNPSVGCPLPQQASAFPPAPAGTPCASDGNPCTVDQCSGAGSCIHTSAPDGTSCGAGLVCTGGTCVSQGG
jgi:hypothetical protein